ncbi:MAG: hypothetical protein ACLVEU_04400 [Bacteroides cellulosilyticus]
MEDVFKKFVQQAKYLMVDETTELVGVETPEGKAYRRKYWVFFCKACQVIITITAAEHLMWQRPSLIILWDLSTDGYTVYRMYDGEGSKVLHIGAGRTAGGCGLMLCHQTGRRWT